MQTLWTAVQTATVLKPATLDPVVKDPHNVLYIAQLAADLKAHQQRLDEVLAYLHETAYSTTAGDTATADAPTTDCTMPAAGKRPSANWNDYRG